MKGRCSKCNAVVDVSFSSEEIDLFKAGIADLLVFGCPECGTQLVVNNPFRTQLRLDQLIQDIYEAIRAHNMVVFCGAGLSAQSGLPLAKDLIGAILEGLALTTDGKEAILRSGIPFEVFMELLSEESDCDPLLKIFEGGEPNKGHIFLAKLAKAGYLNTICTTNFDQLLERALEQEGLTLDKSYEVLYRDDQLETIDWNSSIVRVIKLHGTIEDRQSIAATLHAVAAEALSQQRSDVIHTIFSSGAKNVVLVLGYSCSDTFDISPQIEQVTALHALVVLIDHKAIAEGNVTQEVSAEELGVRTENNPFHHFPNGMRVLCDTSVLMDSLWERFGWPIVSPIPQSGNINWRDYVGMWISENKLKLGDIPTYSIGGRLLSTTGRYDDAIAQFNQCRMAVSRSGNRAQETRSLANLGFLYRQRNEYALATDHHELGLRLARAGGDKQAEVMHLLGLGDVAARIGRLGEAVANYRQALAIAAGLPVRSQELEALTSLGWALREQAEYSEATEVLTRALFFARLVGDKYRECAALRYAGDCFASLKDYENAHKYYTEALRIGANLGSRQHKKSALEGLGIACKGLKRHREAIQYLREALEMSENLGDSYWVSSVNLDLGNVYLEIQDYPQAQDCFLQALQVARDLHNELNELKCLNSLGAIYLCLGNSREAVEHFEAALAISSRVFRENHPNTMGIKKNVESARGVKDSQV